MKGKFLFLALLSMMFLGACTQEIVKVPNKLSLNDANEVGSVELSFSNEQESKTISISVEGDWKVYIPAEAKAWLSVEPSEGTAATKQDVSLTVTTKAQEVPEKGVEPQPRSAKIAFICGGAEQKAYVEVFQEKYLAKMVRFLHSEVATTGSAKTVNVPVEVVYVDEWTATTTADWLTVTPDGFENLKVQFAENTGNAKREATIHIASKAQPDNYNWDIKVTQHIKAVKADLLDVVFDQTGKATDISPLANTVTLEDNAEVVTMEQVEGVWAPKFPHAPGANPATVDGVRGGMYLVNYGSWMSKIDDGYTIQCTFIPGQAHNDKESKPFGGTGAGGFCISFGTQDAKTNEGDGEKVQRAGTIELVHNGNKAMKNENKWNFIVSSQKPVQDELYTATGVWDGTTLYIFVNGKLESTGGCPMLRHMTTTEKVLGIGANYTNTGANGAFGGHVLSARVWDAPITDVATVAATELSIYPNETRFIK
jgi:hypothetical protein